MNYQVVDYLLSLFRTGFKTDPETFSELLEDAPVHPRIITKGVCLNVGDPLFDPRAVQRLIVDLQFELRHQDIEVEHIRYRIRELEQLLLEYENQIDYPFE